MDNVHSIIDDNIDDITNHFDKHINNFSLEKVVDIIPECIQFVEKYTKLSGHEKKDLVVEIIKYLIDSTDAFGNDDIIDPLVKKLVPSIIDNLISVEKNKIMMKKIKKKCFKTNIFKLSCFSK